MTPRLAFRLLLGLAWLAASLGRTPPPALAADGVVGSGTPTSCTEAAFNTVLSTVQASGSGTITFNCGPDPITIVFTGEKVIQLTVTIDGGGKITLSGANATRLFTVAGPNGPLLGGRLTLRGLTLRNGAASEGGAILHLGRSLQISNSLLIANQATTDNGGAIASYGPATLTDTQILSNTAPASGGKGGGLYNAGTLSMTNSSLINNAARSGGALFGENATTQISNSLVQSNSSVFGGGIGHSGGTLTLNQVLIADNGDENDPGGNADTGGGVHLQGPGIFTLTAVTFWQNRAQGGGGLAQDAGSLTLLNSTFSDNRAKFGGGLYLTGGTLSIQHVTIFANTAIGVPANPVLGSGGGIYGQAGTLDLKNSLLSGNRRLAGAASDNCYLVTVPAANFNLSSDDTCGFGTGRDNVALPLGPLQNNGGFTPTHLLPQGSPAIDAGTNTGCPAVDQRGQARPVGATCDVGAIEARPADFVTRLYLPALQK